MNRSTITKIIIAISLLILMQNVTNAQKAELVVQDASSYQKLLDRVEELEALDGIKRGVADVEAGRRAQEGEHWGFRYEEDHGIRHGVAGKERRLAQVPDHRHPRSGAGRNGHGVG